MFSKWAMASGASLVMVWSTVLPATVAAQCCCRGGSDASSSLLMQMHMHQMMMSQMQQMQASQLDALVQKMGDKDADALKAALENLRPEIRWAAARAIAKRGLPLQEALMGRLTDPHSDVRQAARGALIQLSALEKSRQAPPQGRSAKSARGVDFGPAPQASRTAQQTAARKWSDWWATQEKGRAADAPAATR